MPEVDFVELMLKREALARYGLPAIAYPVPKQTLLDTIGGSGDLPLPEMLFGLQQKSARDCPDWHWPWRVLLNSWRRTMTGMSSVQPAKSGGSRSVQSLSMVP